MITVTYRLIGSVSNPSFDKSFDNRNDADSWIKAQGNILVLSIESSGAAAMNRIFR
jgi:hypothetical protein